MGKDKHEALKEIAKICKSKVADSQKLAAIIKLAGTTGDNDSDDGNPAGGQDNPAWPDSN